MVAVTVTNDAGAPMKIISICLAIAMIAIYVPTQAVAASRDACRAAVRDKHPCAGMRHGTPALAACFRSAMERCMKGGPGAI